MIDRRAISVTLVASAVGAVLHVALASSGIDPFFPTAAAIACVVVAAALHGARSGAVCGLVTGGVLLWMHWNAGLTPSFVDLMPGVVLSAIGLAAGTSGDLLRRQVGGANERELTARRETYQLRRRLEEHLTRRHEPEAAAESEAEAEAEAEPEVEIEDAPGVDVALEESLRKISSALNEARLFETALDAARDVSGAARVTFHVHDRRSDRLLDGVTSPSGDPRLVGDLEMLLRAALKRREVVTRETDLEAFAHASPEVQLVLPIFDRVILAGLLVVEGDAAVATERRVVVGVIACAFGLALSGVRLAERCDRQERTDPLTGLSGVTEIRDTLGRALERGRTGVLLVAADGVREVNASYGRKAGDKSVQALAKLLSLEVGAEGTVARYGGATLLVVLPGFQLEGAASLAERLIRRVPASISAGPEGLARPLTISVGAAGAAVGPIDALLGQAEGALKAAQSAGGDRCRTETVEGAIHA